MLSMSPVLVMDPEPLLGFILPPRHFEESNPDNKRA